MCQFFLSDALSSLSRIHEVGESLQRLRHVPVTLWETGSTTAAHVLLKQPVQSLAVRGADLRNLITGLVAEFRLSADDHGPGSAISV